MASALKIVNEFFPKVKRVADATRNLKIEVTPKDVKDSTRKSHKGCAMAVACKRALDLDGMIVSVKTAYLVKDDTAIRYTIPESVSREVVSFDRKGGFEPGSYHLQKISKSLRLGKHTGGKDHQRSPHKTKLRTRFSHHTEGIRAALGSKKHATN
jgi:hypothetical protein